jgi:ribose transport system permease protein
VTATDVRPRAGQEQPRPAARRAFAYGNEVTLVGILAVAWVALSLAYPTFHEVGNIQNVLSSIAMVAIVGVGMTMVILTGGIDVSVGSGVAVCAVIVAKYVLGGGSVLIAVLLGVVVGALLGAVNGVVIAYGRVAPIITTFATLNLFRFVALQIFENQQVNGIPPTLSWFGPTGRTLGVPNAFLVAVVLTAVAWWYLKSYSTGRHLFAIGSNRDTALFAGVRVARREFTVYVVTGLLVGLASAVAVGSGGVVQPNVGTGFELQVVAAVVIGGTSILGGRGSALCTLLGALLVGTLRSALVTMGAPGLLTDFFLGLFILAAVAVDLVREKRRTQR